MAQIKNVVTVSPEQVMTIAPGSPEAGKLRVAAYARVSSDSCDQLNSYLAQVDYYSKHIAENPDWELADIYADEGISGLDARNRDDFNRMIADCREGKIDRVLCKSVSRFARNTRDYLHYMRELTKLGISICFEKENIDTGKMSSEQVAAIYGAFAQMESTNHANNMSVSVRIRMEKRIYLPSSTAYGYKLADKGWEIVPEQAEIVQYIFRSYLEGRGMDDLASELQKRGVDRGDGSVKWYHSTIQYILTNLAYTGDTIWGKSFHTKSLPIRKVRNEGQRPKYYVENAYPAIISKEEFEQVQRRIGEKRQVSHRKGSIEKTVFHGHIYCGKCGAACRRKIINGKPYWVCHRHDAEKARCPVPQLPETEITIAVLRLYHKLRQDNGKLLERMLAQLQEVRECELSSNRKIRDIDKEIAQISERNLVLTRLKSKGIVDPALYLSQQDEMERKLRDLRRLRRKTMESTGDDVQIRATESMLDYLEEAPEWMDGIEGNLFGGLIDRIILRSDGELGLQLMNGLELTETIERT